MELLGALLQKASPQTAAVRVQDAMKVADHRARYQMMAMLLHAGAVIGSKEVATALLETVGEAHRHAPFAAAFSAGEC